MPYADVSWLVSARLRRVKSALLGSIVEAKLRQLKRAVKAGFNRNQPRVPAGNPRGGEWARPGSGGGGGSGNDTLGDTQIAQNAPRRGRGRGSATGATLRQEAQLQGLRAEAQAAIRRVQQIDPNWKPSQSVTRPNSIESQIKVEESNLREAEARMRELAQEPADRVMNDFAQGFGRDLFGNPNWSREKNTVAVSKVDDVVSLGMNSDAPSGYTLRDSLAASGMRDVLIRKYPDVMSTDNVGQFPNDALFHAEVTSLLRAARANGGTLKGKTVEVTVDREMCNSCEKVLPLVSSELGNPTIRFVDNEGNITILRNGKWDQ